MNVLPMSQTQKMIAGLTIATALIHLLLAITSRGDTMFLVLFLLNAVGYLTLLAAMYLDIEFFNPYRTLARTALIAFASVTVVMYFVFNWPDVWGVMGLVDKAIEIALVVLLIQNR